MTREQAEAAGWEISPTTQHGFIINSEAMKTTLEQGCPRSTLQVNSCVVLSAKDAEAALLAAITAIERYPDAVKLLEEAKEVLRKQRDFDFERDDGARIHNESMDFLAKLEAHHAR